MCQIGCPLASVILNNPPHQKHRPGVQSCQRRTDRTPPPPAWYLRCSPQPDTRGVQVHFCQQNIAENAVILHLIGIGVHGVGIFVVGNARGVCGVGLICIAAAKGDSNDASPVSMSVLPLLVVLMSAL